MKYTLAHIEAMENYVNNEGLSKRDAIKKAGFSDSSCYYLTLKRLKIKSVLRHTRIKQVPEGVALKFPAV